MPTDETFPFTPADPLDPPERYAALLRDEPVAQVAIPTGDLVWLVSRHEDVRRVLADRRFSRQAITAPGAPRLLPLAEGSKSIFVMDPPEHSRLRRLVSGAFSPARIRALGTEVRALADDLVAAMRTSGPPADLVAGLAQPLPITVICRLLGVPYEDVEQFRAWTDVMLSYDRGRREEVVAARGALSGYLTRLIDAKRAAPTDDVLMDLINAADDGDRLDDEELLAFGYTLLGAGYHATTSGLVHAVLTLLRRPADLERLRKEPELLPLPSRNCCAVPRRAAGLGRCASPWRTSSCTGSASPPATPSSR